MKSLSPAWLARMPRLVTQSITASQTAVELPLPVPVRPPQPPALSIAAGSAFVANMAARWWSEASPTPPKEHPKHRSLPAYLAPNERFPARMLSVTHGAMAGAYIGLGTERCWITAALHPQLWRLYLIDRDPRVVYYNRINVALLHAAAGARTTYLHLRLHASPTAWHQAATGLPEDRRLLMQNPEAHAWWRQRVRDSGNKDMALFHARPEEAFAGANYLYDNALFANVSQFATDENRVTIQPVHLSKPTEVAHLRRLLQLRRETISLFDISNAWWRCYLTEHSMHAMMETLKPVTTPETLLLATSKHRAFLGESYEFYYFAAHTDSALQYWQCFRRHLEYLGDSPGHLRGMATVDGHLSWAESTPDGLKDLEPAEKHCAA